MGRWTDERCDIWWGDRQCLEDVDHVDHDGGGHHVFDLRDLGVAQPTLVRPGAPALVQRCCDLHRPGVYGTYVLPGEPHTRPACCDPGDCGPCCARCPTCPTVARRRADQVTADG